MTSLKLGLSRVCCKKTKESLDPKIENVCTKFALMAMSAQYLCVPVVLRQLAHKICGTHYNNAAMSEKPPNGRDFKSAILLTLMALSQNLQSKILILLTKSKPLLWLIGAKFGQLLLILRNNTYMIFPSYFFLSDLRPKFYLLIYLCN